MLMGKGKQGKELSELKDCVAQEKNMLVFFNMTLNHRGLETERTGSTAKF